MATGDIKNNLLKLQTDLRHCQYPGHHDSNGMVKGDPASYLPIIHFILLDASPLLARHLATKGYDLYGKKDMRFLESVYRILRDEFNYKPALRKDQFFSMGFAEHKMIFVMDLIRLCKHRIGELERLDPKKERQSVESLMSVGSDLTSLANRVKRLQSMQSMQNQHGLSKGGIAMAHPPISATSNQDALNGGEFHGSVHSDRVAAETERFALAPTILRRDPSASPPQQPRGDSDIQRNPSTSELSPLFAHNRPRNRVKPPSPEPQVARAFPRVSRELLERYTRNMAVSTEDVDETFHEPATAPSPMPPPEPLPQRAASSGPPFAYATKSSSQFNGTHTHRPLRSPSPAPSSPLLEEDPTSAKVYRYGQSFEYDHRQPSGPFESQQHQPYGSMDVQILMDQVASLLQSNSEVKSEIRYLHDRLDAMEKMVSKIAQNVESALGTDSRVPQMVSRPMTTQTGAPSLPDGQTSGHVKTTLSPNRHPRTTAGVSSVETQENLEEKPVRGSPSLVDLSLVNCDISPPTERQPHDFGHAAAVATDRRASAPVVVASVGDRIVPQMSAAPTFHLSQGPSYHPQSNGWSAQVRFESPDGSAKAKESEEYVRRIQERFKQTSLLLKERVKT
ncbi:Centrosomal spindle body, CEP44-domain-containing protein [Polychytrium aggregatum]|uniref:Centrosomal spindle body, CEP44-domain-containing protein n=1 Tax=Polychytrium aggregatum TaxID=110093 RepID=UPI0022FED157|nr:Centrosomal spindle body, CEP44-domain-containing protein [Polychytrium aggregatum]KAI9208199.1 Centrosomal spindle body, CEP44-domain-containing protein [Polychytrium aggregatum]